MMSWEVRNGRRYFYRSVRQDGQVRRIYLGTDNNGVAASILDERERHERLQAEQAVRDYSQYLDELGEMNDRLHAAARLLTSSLFLLAGFRRHSRHAWKKEVNREDQETTDDR